MSDERELDEDTEEAFKDELLDDELEREEREELELGGGTETPSEPFSGINELDEDTDEKLDDDELEREELELEREEDDDELELGIPVSFQIGNQKADEKLGAKARPFTSWGPTTRRTIIDNNLPQKATVNVNHEFN